MKTNNQPTKKQLQEFYKHISDALREWASVCYMSDDKNWSYEYDFTEEDIVNAIYIFKSVISNIGIKKGLITEENAFKFGFTIRDFVAQYTGFDTHEFAQKLKENETETTSEIPEE